MFLFLCQIYLRLLFISKSREEAWVYAAIERCKGWWRQEHTTGVSICWWPCSPNPMAVQRCTDTAKCIVQGEHFITSYISVCCIVAKLSAELWNRWNICFNNNTFVLYGISINTQKCLSLYSKTVCKRPGKFQRSVRIWMGEVGGGHSWSFVTDSADQSTLLIAGVVSYCH